jgi:DNA-binding response OmpR family regulator
MRVAIIDDEVTVCKLLQKALSKEGYEVESFLAGNPFLPTSVFPIWMAWKS